MILRKILSFFISAMFHDSCLESRFFAICQNYNLDGNLGGDLDDDLGGVPRPDLFHRNRSQRNNRAEYTSSLTETILPTAVSDRISDALISLHVSVTTYSSLYPIGRKNKNLSFCEDRKKTKINSAFLNGICFDNRISSEA